MSTLGFPNIHSESIVWWTYTIRLVFLYNHTITTITIQNNIFHLLKVTRKKDIVILNIILKMIGKIIFSGQNLNKTLKPKIMIKIISLFKMSSDNMDSIVIWQNISYKVNSQKIHILIGVFKGLPWSWGNSISMLSTLIINNIYKNNTKMSFYGSMTKKQNSKKLHKKS